MIGFHYTSARLYKRIKKRGLIPYDLSRQELSHYFPDGVTGIWIWNKRLRAIAELGSILYQVATKRDTKIVKLRVRYEEDDVLHYEDRMVELYHDGHIGDWAYHNGKQTSHVVTKPISTEDIELMQVFNVLDLVGKEAKT